jgi:hypothetical protein
VTTGLTEDVASPSAGAGLLAERTGIDLQHGEWLTAMAIVLERYVHLAEIAATLLLAGKFAQAIIRGANPKVERICKKRSAWRQVNF